MKLDCAFTPSDAHVISGSEDGKDSSALSGLSVMAKLVVAHSATMQPGFAHAIATLC